MHLLIILLIGFIVPSYANAVTKNPYCPQDSIPQIIIVNGFDPSKLEVRKNKKELFRDMADSLQLYLADVLGQLTDLHPVIIPGRQNDVSDSIIFRLLGSKQALYAVVINSVDANFEEMGEKESEDSDGKYQVTTTYDLCTRVQYVLYRIHGEMDEKTKTVCDFFTTRTVKGRVQIHFGPDIVAKKKHTYDAIRKNAVAFITDIFSMLE